MVEPSDTLNDQEAAPKMPKHRCINQSTAQAFKEISAFFDQLLDDGDVFSVKKKQTHEGRLITIKFDDDKQNKISGKFALLMNHIFPSLFAYGKYQLFVPKEEFQRRLESEQSIDDLIEGLSQIAVCPEKNATFLARDEEQEAKNWISTPVESKEASSQSNDNNAQAANPEIEEFFRRVPKEELELLFSAENLTKLTKDELKAFKKGDWQHPIFLGANWIGKALAAYKAGKLTKERISTLLLYYECQQTLPTNVSFSYQLFDENKKPNMAAFEIIKKATVGYFSEKELEFFLNNLKELPPERGQFFKVPIAGFCMDEQTVYQKLDIENQNLPPIALEYSYHVRQHRLCLIPTSDNKGVEHVILPPDLFYELLKAKYGKDAMKPHAILGLSSAQDFERIDQRDVLLPARFLRSAPKKADGFAVSLLDFYFHDLVFHVYLESCNFHKPAWLELCLFFKEKKQSTIEDFLADRGLVIYLGPKESIRVLGYDPSPGEYFWAALGIDGFALDEEKDFLKMTVEYITQHAVRWERDYGITLADLHKFVERQEKSNQKNFDIFFARFKPLLGTN